MTLQVSKCCASPLLVRGNPNSTGWNACSLCKEPTDAMSYPFTTVAQMEAWLKKRKAYRGVAYTANPNPNLTPKPMCGLSSLGAFLVGMILGVILFAAIFII